MNTIHKQDEEDESLHPDDQTQHYTTTPPASSVHLLDSNDIPDTEADMEESVQDEDKPDNDHITANHRQVTDDHKLSSSPQCLRPKCPSSPSSYTFLYSMTAPTANRRQPTKTTRTMTKQRQAKKRQATTINNLFPNAGRLPPRPPRTTGVLQRRMNKRKHKMDHKASQTKL